MAIRVEVVDWWAIGESFCHIISRDRFVVRWSMALTVCYALLVLAAGAGAFYSLTLRCEGFGCTGIGILWMTWAAVLFAPTLALGCYLAMRPNQRDGFSRFSRESGRALPSQHPPQRAAPRSLH